jgi:asparagine synthase (glutamine-hydrolysing)
MITQGPRGAALRQALDAMRDTLAHRGPDDAGSWVTESAEGAVGLGFRRLSIIDLSALGHQPMASVSGRFTMVFNGEVYNFPALRRELEGLGARFKGHSDSEIILAAFERWGIPETLPRLVGMFGIAVWDAERRVLTLIRDRLGKKPLFVYARAGTVLFGSELKALVAGPGFERTVDPAALTAYLRFLYVPAPGSIYQNVVKLPPGHYLEIRDAGAPLPESRAYWKVEDAARAGLANPWTGSVAEATDELERLLREAVEMRLQSDVPLGALLSGGIDSSTVVALMRAGASGSVKTFTIGFDVAAHDESRHAVEIARYLGTDHTALTLTGEDALAVVPKLAQMYDEPLADPSHIPTYLVSELARRQVTVALTGDGGDELFGGYNRYTVGTRILPDAASLPGPLRRVLSRGVGAVSPEAWDRLARGVGSVIPGVGDIRLPGTKMAKLSRLLGGDDVAAMYRTLVSFWDDPCRFVIGGVERPGDFERIMGSDTPSGLLDRMMLTDQRTYLADDLLAKVDRASMAVSLEARVPLLDHRVVEFAWRVPSGWKIRDGKGKWLLRQVLYRHVPEALVDRPKMGFSVPIETWLRGPLKGWGNDLLSSGRGRTHLDLDAVQRAWNGFLSGRSGDGMGMWAILQYRAWEEAWLS